MSSAARSSQQFSLHRSASAADASSRYNDYGFIAVLGLAQRLRIDFLPITWQAVLESLEQDGKGARGGQAKIYQSLVNVETSFAFKRFRRNPSTFDSEYASFRDIVSEMIVLSHNAIRKHPYIARLEGLCWDISNEKEVWPVLVFEKSHLGDLYHFSRSGKGRDLSIDGRLKLCTDIGVAIRDMHLNSRNLQTTRAFVANVTIDIVHGDIKPKNVLIFEEEPLKYYARVADFGFSTHFRHDDELIQMPKSPIWYAPEWHDRNFRPDAAKKMDVYSFGMLRLWLLLRKDLCTNTPTLTNSIQARDLFDENCPPEQNLLEQWKSDRNGELLERVTSVVDASLSFSAETKTNLTRFFKATLAFDPGERSLGFESLLSLLAPAR